MKTIWEIELQIKNSVPLKPFEWPFKGEITDCADYLKNHTIMLQNSAGVLVEDNGVGNIFFKIDNNGELLTDGAPFPGLRYNTVNKPL